MEEKLGRLLPKVEDLDFMPFFCEENIWKLCKRLIDSGVEEKCVRVVIISNANKQVPLWKQKNTSNRDYVVWDYHVVLLLTDGHEKLIYDMNSTLPIPCPAKRYWEETLNLTFALPPQFKRKVRIVDGQYYLTNFSSDRRHMKNDAGQFIFPPPPWPMLFHSEKGHNLDDFIDMENQKLSPVSKVYSEDDIGQEPAMELFGFYRRH